MQSLPPHAILSEAPGLEHMFITPDRRYAFVKNHQAIADFAAQLGGARRTYWELIDLLTGEKKWLSDVATPPVDSFGIAAKVAIDTFVMGNEVIIVQTGEDFHSINRFTFDGRSISEPRTKHYRHGEYVRTMVKEDIYGDGDRLLISTDKDASRYAIFDKKSKQMIGEIPRETGSPFALGDQHYAFWDSQANELRAYRLNGEVAFKLTKQQFYSLLPMHARLAGRLLNGMEGFKAMLEEFSASSRLLGSTKGRSPSLFIEFKAQHKRYLFSIDHSGKIALEANLKYSLIGHQGRHATTPTGLIAFLDSKDGSNHVLHLRHPQTGVRKDVQLKDLHTINQTESYLLVNHGNSFTKQNRVVRFFDNWGRPLRSIELKSPQEIEYAFETGDGSVIIQQQTEPNHYLLNPKTGALELREGRILGAYNMKEGRVMPFASKEHRRIVVADLLGTVYAGSYVNPRVIDFDGRVISELNDMDFSKGIGRVEFPSTNRVLVLNSERDKKGKVGLHQFSW